MTTKRKIVVFAIIFLYGIVLCYPGVGDGCRLFFARRGMPEKVFFLLFPKKTARTYRRDGRQEWLSYDGMWNGTRKDIVTFHLQDGNLAGWSVNDREEVVREYLGEFCSSRIAAHPKMFSAIQGAFQKLPENVFLAVTDRDRPILFTEYYYVGIGRFANSSEIIAADEDAPTFRRGMTIIKLSTELEDVAQSSDEIEGIVLHEIAHRYLEHARQIRDRNICDIEREANRLVKAWGCAEEFRKASDRFGQERHGGSICKD